MNRYIYCLPVTPSYLTCSIMTGPVLGYNTLTNVRKRTLAKPARNNLTTQSVTNLATQPETTW